MPPADQTMCGDEGRTGLVLTIAACALKMGISQVVKALAEEGFVEENTDTWVEAAAEAVINTGDCWVPDNKVTFYDDDGDDDDDEEEEEEEEEEDQNKENKGVRTRSGKTQTRKPDGVNALLNTPTHPKMPPTANPRAPSEASTRSRLSLSNVRSSSTSNISSNSISTSISTRARARAPSTASTASSINAHTFSRSPNATPMPLPKKRQSAIPSLGLARSQSISVVGSGSVAGGARKSLPVQTQVFPKSQVVPKTPSPPNAMRVPVSVSVAGSPRVPRSTSMSMIASSSGAATAAAATQNQNQNQTPARPRARITSLTPPRPVPSIASPKISFTSPSPRKPLVAGNGSPASKLPGTSTPKGTPPRVGMSNSTSSNTNTTNTTGTGSSVFGGTPSKIKAKATPTKTNTPTKTKTSAKIRATPSKESLPGVPWSQQGLLDEPLALTMGNGVGNGEVAFSVWGETDDMEMLTDVGEGEVDEE
ncbi:hypothetical protein DXG01_011622, partial [Tephrocybe rancida]